jgi:hypothetical protein
MRTPDLVPVIYFQKDVCPIPMILLVMNVFQNDIVAGLVKIALLTHAVGMPKPVREEQFPP